MMNGCKKCHMMTGVIFLALGVAYLAADLTAWDFWNIQWYTALFLLMGLCGIAMNKCPDCCAKMEGTPSKRR